MKTVVLVTLSLLVSLEARSACRYGLESFDPERSELCLAQTDKASCNAKPLCVWRKEKVDECSELKRVVVQDDGRLFRIAFAEVKLVSGWTLTCRMPEGFYGDSGVLGCDGGFIKMNIEGVREGVDEYKVWTVGGSRYCSLPESKVETAPSPSKN